MSFGYISRQWRPSYILKCSNGIYGGGRETYAFNVCTDISISIKFITLNVRLGYNNQVGLQLYITIKSKYLLVGMSIDRYTRGREV